MASTETIVQARGTNRIVPLDGLRGVAILTVMIFHAFGVPGLWMGVDLFFVLSGFLITGILFNQKGKPFGKYIGHFYARRARRILPAYVVALIITGLVFGFSFLRYWYMLFGFMNFQGMGIKALPAGPPFLPLWSLAVEEQFYFIWPLLVFALGRRGLVRCAAALVIIAPLLRYFCTPFLPRFSDHAPIWQWLPFRMDDLAAGALLALLWPEISTRARASEMFRRSTAILSMLAVVLGFVSLLVLHHNGIKTTYNTPLGNALLYSITLIIMSAMALLALIGAGKWALSSWPLVWLGRISYSLYLIHLMALYLAHHNPWIGLGASLIYATIMWFVVEKPIITWGANKERVLVAAK